MNRDTFRQFLEEVLYKVDPASTYCAENEIFDEYAGEARIVTELVYDSKFEVPQALQYTFQKQFEGHYDFKRLNTVLKIIEEKIVGVKA